MTKPIQQRVLTDEQRYEVAHDQRRDRDIARAYGISSATVINCRRMHGIDKKPPKATLKPLGPVEPAYPRRSLTVLEWVNEGRAKKGLPALVEEE